MIRALVILVLTGVPAAAWEARVYGPICKLVFDGDAASVVVTYDPRVPKYGISITAAQPWPEGAVFVIRFDGPRGNVISTDRHITSDAGATLTVTDRGFGNVLNGLEFNETATALLGNRAVTVSLDGAGPAVQEFRACTSGLIT